jgi:hypothetical protein
MHTTVKVFIIVIAVAAYLSTGLAQVNDSTAVNDSLSAPIPAADSSFASDTLKVRAVNQDSLNAQDSLALMKKKFDQFKYGDVISIANQLLLKKTPMTRDEILNIYRLKGISHYSLSEDDAAKKSFIEILRVDTSYTLDSNKVSPKIISFFKQVKTNYIQQQKDIEARTVVRIDTVYVPKVEYDIEHENRLKNAIARSLIVPGLGQLYLDVNFKSVFLTVLGSASLAASIYYFIQTDKKEKAYLIETNPDMIESRYADYNDAYRYRNISLISFGVVWLYSQLDLLFFSEQSTGQKILSNSSLNYNQIRGLTLNMKYSF